MEIKFLKAGNGDAILIHHNSKNILIDGGNEPSHLEKELLQISAKKEIIDLLIVTHHDDDHVLGIIKLLEDIDKNIYGAEKNFIKKVFFNSPRLILKKIPIIGEGEFSYVQAHKIENLLMKVYPQWLESDITTSLTPPIYFDDIEIEILAPEDTTLLKYAENKQALLAGGKKCDWTTPLKHLEKWNDDKSLDSDLANSSSIVLLVKYSNKKILLLGDVTPNKIIPILEKMYIANESARLNFDYVKLSHHGSYRNINQKILSIIDCSNFIIMSDGKQALPDKKCLLKILTSKYRNSKTPINFYFNYGELIEKLNITPQELKQYNFKLKGNNNVNGLYM